MNKHASSGKQLELRGDQSGRRHYLDGTSVHCGSTLELQHIRQRWDEDGTLVETIYLSEWTRVRYEADLWKDPPTVTLYADVGGHRAALVHHIGMRLRWPEARR